MRTSQKRRRKKKHTGRNILFGAALVCLLALVWRGTSLAVEHFLEQQAVMAEFDDAEGKGDGAEEEGDVKEKEDAQAAGQNEDGEAENLLLVNKEHPLDEDFSPELIKHRDYGVEVDKTIYEPLCEMLQAGEKEGLRFWIASGYRSLKRQRELLDEDIEELVHRGYSYSEAYEEVTRETMPVGCSEHATGLAVDIVSKDYQILDEKQGRTEEIRWLQENCWKYGFILRYPQDKEDVTKVDYESWHFRYVGKEAARAIMEEGITLEEYLD